MAQTNVTAAIVNHTAQSDSDGLTVYKCERFQAETVNTTLNYTVEAPPPKCKSFRLIDSPTANFAGREDLLEQVHHLLQSCSLKTTLWDRIVVIHGLGGMGKSELARMYVQMNIDDPIIQNVAWIDSETKSSLESSFKSIAHAFRIKTENVRVEEIAASVYQYFSENFTSGLFIFDNVEQLRNEEPYFGILNYLPSPLAKLPLILITSRIKDWEGPEARKNTVGISQLSLDQSVKLLIPKLKLNEIEEKDATIEAAVRDLAEALQGYPLGLTLAASNICCSGGANVSDEIRKYIDLLEVPNGGWMDHKHSAGSTSKYNLVMKNVWKATFDRIKSEGAQGECALTLFYILAFLPTDDLQKSLVDEIIESDYFHLKEHLVKGYSILEKYSMIGLRRTEWGGTWIGIHRHVQRCTRESLDSLGVHTNLVSIGRALSQYYGYNNKSQEKLQIHRHLKQRKWPDNSLRISLIFLSEYYPYGDFPPEVAKDITEAIKGNEQAYSEALGDGYRTLLEFSLYLLSVWDHADKLPYAQRVQWNTEYEGVFDDAVEIFVSSLIMKDSLCGSGMSTEVRQHITRRLDSMSKGMQIRNQKNADTMRISLMKALNETDLSSQHLVILPKIFTCLCCKYWDENIRNTTFFMKTALKLHFQYYTTDSILHCDEYWRMGTIRFSCLSDVLDKLKRKRSSQFVADDKEKAIVESFVTCGGLELVQQRLHFKIPSDDLMDLTVFLLVLLVDYNCSDDFAKTPSDQVLWAMMWFALFPGNCSSEDSEGVQWSLDSVAKEIRELNCLSEYDCEIGEPGYWSRRDSPKEEDLLIRALLPHLTVAMSRGRDAWSFKFAVELMDKDIEYRQKGGSYSEKWKAAFENIFMTVQNIHFQILEVGSKHGLVLD